MNPQTYIHTDQPLLPHRFRESSFRRYETKIALAARSYPNVITVDSVAEYQLSPVTFSNRFRDAMRSLYDNHWPTTMVDVPRFRQVYPEIQVSELGALVLIGDPELITIARNGMSAYTQIDQPTSPGQPSSGAQPVDYRKDSEDEVILTFIMRGCHNRSFTSGVMVRKLMLHEIEKFESAYDVAISQHDEDGGYSLVQ